MKTVIWLNKIFLLFILQACSDEQGGSLSSSSNQTEAVKSLNATADDEEIIEKVDASKLEIYKISIAKARNKSTLHTSIEFTTSGRTENVRVLICPMEKTEQTCSEEDGDVCAEGGACFRTTSLASRIRLNTMLQGESLIRLSPCLNSSENAMDPKVLCGPEATQVYRSGFYDPRLETLLRDERRVVDKIRNTGAAYQQMQKKFVSDLYACHETNQKVLNLLEERTRLVKQFVRAPIDWFMEAALAASYQTIGEETTENALDATKNAAKHYSEKIFGNLCQRNYSSTLENIEKKSEEAATPKQAAKANQLCQILQTFGAFGDVLAMLSPVAGLAGFTEAVSTVSQSEEEKKFLVPISCNAERNFQSSMNSNQYEWAFLTERLKKITTELDMLGY